jgi:hypothetical protein
MRSSAAQKHRQLALKTGIEFLLIDKPILPKEKGQSFEGLPLLLRALCSEAKFGFDLQDTRR